MGDQSVQIDSTRARVDHVGSNHSAICCLFVCLFVRACLRVFVCFLNISGTWTSHRGQ